MGSKKLRRVGLSQELCDRLNRHQIVTCQDFLCLSPLELMKMTGLSYRGVHELLCMVSRACAPQMQTAYGLKMQTSASVSPVFLATTLSALDEALHGGVACGSLTEITGPPGCGKTQFCMMMSILATLPTNMGGLEGGVVYIDTESAFSAERLVEIAESRFPRYFNTEEKLLLTSSKVHLYRELSCDEVLQRIESLEEEIISKRVKLVIIDSVASVVRKEFDAQLQGNMRERNKFLAREAATLKYLAEEFSIPVILTNQITTHLSGALASQADLVSPADDLSLSEGPSGSSCVTAALGNTWSHSVNTRLIFQYLGSERRQNLTSTKRQWSSKCVKNEVWKHLQGKEKDSHCQVPSGSLHLICLYHPEGRPGSSRPYMERELLSSCQPDPTRESLHLKGKELNHPQLLQRGVNNIFAFRSNYKNTACLR
ncbi:DNA repair protein RAD51 homolog 2 isoform X1 [Felis catus]|uniref:DNA repair protein RAD51 homolog 2 isoform X1 n=1 Tax=Felis catus TaxID=9685 RepID=UPI001D19948E|nr:DNA repair protein RAD51 homolog 2 isoform X1 [Felis catus]XP_044916047.1 DNA repair protein RAD51 homolog 2 isoform X1 [Felis catus]XP_044916048.1 DNA repair protein RAD51 homolog 2 isoform X1 [Felis catus]